MTVTATVPPCASVPSAFSLKRKSKCAAGATPSPLPVTISPEAIKAAEATALTVFHLRNGLSKAKLRKLIEEQYYALDGLSVEYLHEILKKDDSSQGTMPVAFTVFFESDDFETAIRNAIYIGGDTDTIGAIVGTWAQIIYPIPNDITERVITRLDPKIRQCIYNFDSTVR